MNKAKLMPDYKLKLSSERLTIRDFVDEDWPSVVRRTTAPEVAQYMEFTTDTWREKTKVLTWIAEQRQLDLGTFGKYVEFAVVKDGKAIGDVALKRFSKTNKNAEIGWALDPEEQGRGYATEASAIFLDHCFRTLNLHRVTSVCDARNTASYKLMERLGMRREGHHLQSSFIKGEWVDDLLYAILRDEWFAKPRPAYTVERSSYQEASP